MLRYWRPLSPHTLDTQASQHRTQDEPMCFLLFVKYPECSHTIPHIIFPCDLVQWNLRHTELAATADDLAASEGSLAHQNFSHARGCVYRTDIIVEAPPCATCRY